MRGNDFDTPLAILQLFVETEENYTEFREVWDARIDKKEQFELFMEDSEDFSINFFSGDMEDLGADIICEGEKTNLNAMSPEEQKKLINRMFALGDIKAVFDKLAAKPRPVK